ncbi:MULTISPECIES: hydrolase [unclassified Rhizobacter]|uniref:hydrolase n=1 Tax=unclassified Rhizobacter TaxID=2640088 RepID=UPI0006FF6A8D|nr:MULTISPECIES: hydrolase [unclassified Rhizobacter]KQU79005.1 hydrolase [Rhizobacter sp. Root29]KQW13500.1 hydrolase [Rhizobacter sp. Root1238]KRB06290.1 hydrolase [Rhizobacter sp. Root16D2]
MLSVDALFLDAEPLDAARTALVLIDLQQGIVGFGRAPHDSATVLANAAALADRFHALNALVVRVKVGWHAGFHDLLSQTTDQPAPLPPGGLPAHWWDEPAALPSASGDLQIVKRQWNAFHGTELDLQLRRRGIATLVLGGIVTHIGVEGTARAAWELGYRLVIAEDACSAPLAEPHRASMQYVMPRLGHVRSTARILKTPTDTV